MQTIFDTCFNDCYQQTAYQSLGLSLTAKQPEPMKFKVAKTLNLLDPLLKSFALPRRKQTYKFPRKNLFFLKTETSHIPFVYTPVSNPSTAILFIYCHGSGSTLNHVYEYINSLAWKFGIAAIAYDYTGDGESQKQFVDFQSDLKCILAWAVQKGYDLRRVILCGFSLGSYSALCLKGQMPRILISPLCGITAYIEEKPMRYEGEKFDNLGKALELKARVWITHCTKEIIPISHAKAIQDALLENNKTDQIQFTQIKDGYDHKSAPGYLLSEQGVKILQDFISKSRKMSEVPMNSETQQLKKQLLELSKTVIFRSSETERQSTN